MSQFNELIQSNQPVLVDFYADWCGPCKTLAPVLKEVAGQVNGKAKIIKVNVDNNQEAAAVYHIQSIPTMILFKNGQIKWRHTGVASAAQLLKIISDNF